jgi:hypothetical protein
VYQTLGVAGRDYSIEPLNATADGRPMTALRCYSWWPTFSYARCLLRGNIKITGKWGWPEIPSQIPQATAILASKLLVRSRQAPFGIVTVGLEMGVAMRIAKNDPDVMALLTGLGRDELFV